MALVDRRNYVFSEIYYSVLEPRRCAKHNVACQHSQQTRDVDRMQAQCLQRWPSIKPALLQCLLFAGLRSKHVGMVVLTAGGECKPTPTQCLLKCWASFTGAGQYPFSPCQYFMLAVPAQCFEPKLG